MWYWMLVDLENHFQEASFKEEVGMVQPARRHLTVTGTPSNNYLQSHNTLSKLDQRSQETPCLHSSSYLKYMFDLILRHTIWPKQCSAFHQQYFWIFTYTINAIQNGLLTYQTKWGGLGGLCWHLGILVVTFVGLRVFKYSKSTVHTLFNTDERTA